MALRTSWLAIAIVACASAPPAVVETPAPPAARVRAAARVEPPAEPPVAPPVAEPTVTEPVALAPCPSSPRDKRQLPDHVVKLAELGDAMTVVDLGSGDGYFLCHFSRAVGPRGRVVATEVRAGLVRALKKRVAREALANVEIVRAPANDVGVAGADRIVLVNVWHHLPARKRYAARIARALAPGGKVVVIDFPRRGQAGHGIAPERVLAELAAGGIEAKLVRAELTGQYVIIGSPRAAS
ncbi:MAG TPA: methyltransferase domain-containing protein [Kofleriaceae bacterium]